MKSNNVVMEETYDEYRPYQLDNLPNESKFYFGHIIKWSQDLRPNYVLLAGERNDMSPIIAESIGAKIVLTTGLRDADFIWDFNKITPINKTFDLIISQSILEHILDPFGFVRSLVSLLNREGHLILHSVLPPFPYHRVPIDCLRFFPDWFEAISKKLDIDIIHKAKWDLHLIYMYRRGQ